MSAIHNLLQTQKLRLNETSNDDEQTADFARNQQIHIPHRRKTARPKQIVGFVFYLLFHRWYLFVK